MPIGLDPNRTTPVYLEGDLADHKGDKDACPVFHCRFLTSRQTIEVGDLLEAAAKEQDDHKADELICKALDAGVKSWERIPGFEDRTALYGLLTVAEKWELAYQMQTATRLAERDRKNSASQSIAGGASTAANVTDAA